MPVKVEAVTKDAFQHWLADAKKKFARGDDGSGALRVAAVPERRDAAHPARTGN
jgi:heme/copper-type cytochrome/quinol oxidase subunit 2